MSTMSQRSHLTDSGAWGVVGRLEGGQTQAEVAQAIGVSRSLYARRPIVCVRLTSRHRRDHREWATEHVNWRRNEWNNVLLSDESRFSVHPNNRVFSSGGTVAVGIILRSCTKVSDLVCGGGMLVYGGISIDGRTDLYIIRDGPLTTRRYRDEILRPIVVPYAAAIGDYFILMDDN
ncbi:transposable element Tcb2 transposase [Trichonephila clavipes]|uniref:Transposable element Tcb2 transposase n=1 Tax=Trichonephila clavipes TaxID=2585209 RepID=A0A8X6VX59_TRICX|nr:transposable element Tcb2 transposase [Trichonephila clavipes]